MRITLILNLLVVTVNCADIGESIVYYVNLINREISRASSRHLPQNSHTYRPLGNEDVEYGTFDHIVVGSGAAGAIVASRLSEDTSKSVLLIEAGGKETDFTDIPAMAWYSSLLGYGWNYYTTPQNGSCLAMPNQQCDYLKGKGLGGSTLINSLIYSRGHEEDYDDWFNQGNPGWSFEDVLPFFTKTENSLIDGDDGFHGIGGNLNVEYAQPDSIRLSMFLEANRELRRHIGDYNGKNPLSVGRAQLNTINGRRGSTGKAFLLPLGNRKNLKILTESYATKILIRKKKAYGIRFAKDQQFYVARSRQDIIISAGAIGSPQLLMLSGIGPKAHLQELGIPVLRHLSVGSNLKDHFGYILHFVTNQPEPQEDLLGSLREYLQSKGPLTNAFKVLGLGFYQANSSAIPNYPDTEIMLNGYLGENLDPTRAFSMFVLGLHPKSKGYLRLQSKDPFDYPLINSNAFSDANNEDIEKTYQAIQLALELLNTNAFRRFGTSLEPPQLPACNNYEYLSREYWYCHIRQSAKTLYHAIGTCKMGPHPTRGAVVDHRLKVYGIENLRVADASVMPDINSGHTSAPAMMIGEKAAHMIKYGL